MPGTWKLFAALCMAFGAGLFLHTLFYSGGWSRREQVSTELETLKLENDAAKAKILDLRRQITALRKRPEVQERLVRDQLGYVRPGDLIVELNP